MSIMSYKEWKERTKLGLKPRSKALKFLDACLKEYDENRGSRPHFDALVVGYQAWAAEKPDANISARNKDGAVAELLQQIVQFRDAHMPFAHRGGEKFRSNALLRDIKQGAKALSEGTLKPKVTVPITVGVKDSGKGKGTVIWEEFEEGLDRARKAWSDAFECAQMANQAMDIIARDAAEQQRFRRWFGAANPNSVNTVRRGLRQMWEAFQERKVTIVHRPDIKTHIVNNDDPFEAMEDGFKGADVYGYVYHHSAGSGYRVVMGEAFLGDPDPIEGAAQTIYHELNHKVLKTTDHGYGKDLSMNFAKNQQHLALTNADNWAWYAMSFIKDL